jgi:hypothetical protein
MFLISAVNKTVTNPDVIGVDDELYRWKIWFDMELVRNSGTTFESSRRDKPQ